MYTTTTLNALVTVTNLAWHFGAIHFRFSRQGTGQHKSYVLETCFKSSRLALIWVTLLLDVFYLLFIAGRVLQYVLMSPSHSSGDSLAFFVKMGYLLTAYSLPVVLQYNIIIRYRETPLFLQQYMAFFSKMREKYLLADEKGAKCRKFFSVFIFVGTAINIQNVGILLRKPFQLHLFTSVLENPKTAPIIIRLALYIPQLIVWASMWANLWLYCFHWFTYVTCSLFLIKDLDVNPKKVRTVAKVRESATCFKIIRSMQVLHRLWDTSFQDWMCPSHKSVICSVASLALYGAVKLSGPRATIMALSTVLSLLYLSTVFYKFGQLHERSKKVIQNWKSSPGASRWMRKVMLSVPELTVKIGSFYGVHRTTVVNMLWNILNNTITLFFIHYTNIQS